MCLFLLKDYEIQFWKFFSSKNYWVIIHFFFNLKLSLYSTFFYKFYLCRLQSKKSRRRSWRRGIRWDFASFILEFCFSYQISFYAVLVTNANWIANCFICSVFFLIEIFVLSINISNLCAKLRRGSHVPLPWLHYIIFFD